MKVISGKFTDFDIIYFDDGNKMIVSDYFNLLENGIKNNKITNCSYDVESEIFKYRYNNSEYRIKVKNNSRKLRILLGLMQLENSQKLANENKKLEEKRKEKLLNDARNGIIESEEAKQLYLKELKSNKIKKIFNLFDLSEIENYELLDGILNGLLAVISVALTIGSVLGLRWLCRILIHNDSMIIELLGYLLYGFDFIYAACLVFGELFPEVYTLFTYLLSPLKFVLKYSLALVPQIIKNYLKKREDLKVTNYEIKALKNILFQPKQ